MALKRFTKPKFLEQMGREQLNRLIARYEGAFAVNKIAMPPTTDDEKEYYAALAKLALSESSLPLEFVDALYALEAMANEYARARLWRAVENSSLKTQFSANATHAEFALEVFLADEDLFGRTHDEMQIAKLSSFEHFTSGDRAGKFEKTQDAVVRVKKDVDDWLEQNRESEERVTEIETHELDGEHWFLIRRGDSMSRLAVVEKGQVIVRYLRPARDLVVVYNAQRDELRVHGKGGEVKMICRVFGERFFGNPEHFSVRKSFTLKPLRDEGRDALEVSTGDGIDRIVLRELEVKTDNEHNVVYITRGDDLFAFEEATGTRVVPHSGELVRAVFDVTFTGQKKPRAIHLRAGNRLRVARHCDAAAIQRWLTAKGFRSPEQPAVNRIAILNENLLGTN